MTSRHLARSMDGRVIHRDTCRHARAPWPGVDDLTDDELLDAKLILGMKICRICKPPRKRSDP